MANANLVNKETLKRLERMARSMQRMGEKQALDSLITNLAEEVHHQVGLGFNRQEDPEGRPWKKTYRGGQILRNSGRLRNSLGYRVTGKGFVYGTNVIYAGVQNFGAIIRPKNKKMLAFRVGGSRGGHGKGANTVFAKEVTVPRRQFLPYHGHRPYLPTRWRGGMFDIARQHMKSVMADRALRSGGR